MVSEWSWERKAMRGSAMPKGLSLEDQAAYQAIAALHVRFAKGEVTREQAAKEKQIIRRTYEQRMERGAFWDELCTKTVRLWQEMEAKVNAYRKEPGTATADALVAAIYGIGFTRATTPEEREEGEEHDTRYIPPESAHDLLPEMGEGRAVSGQSESGDRD